MEGGRQLTSEMNVEGAGSDDSNMQIAEAAAPDYEHIDAFEPEKKEFIHEVKIPEEFFAPNFVAPSRNVDTKGPPQEWNGSPQWSALQRFEKGGDLRLFVGMDDLTGVGWQSFPITYEFLDMTSRWEKVAVTLICGNQSGRHDVGPPGFPIERLLEEVKNREEDERYNSVNPPGPRDVIRVKITISRPFKTRSVGISWKSRENTGMMGLRNLGATCYLNALLQMLYHMNSFRVAVYRIPHEGEKLENSITLALQDVFRNLQVAPKIAINGDSCVTTKHLANAFGWSSTETFMQQDATELLKLLIDRLELKMGPDAIKILFEGTTKNFIRCVNVKKESSKEEAFQDIQLDVDDCANIYQSMKRFVTVERLDGENQYDAGEEFGKQDAEKGTEFTKFPHILTIHLKRFAFSVRTMNYTKIHTEFAFPERLHMDQFLSKSADEKAGSAEPPAIYVLHSILIHRGDVGSGHYYSFVKPSPHKESASEAPILPADKPADAPVYEQTDENCPPPPAAAKAAVPTGPTDRNESGWYKFDDEAVYSVDKAEAINYNFGQSSINQTAASAYMLMYIRESMMDTIMKDVSADDIPPSLSSHLDAEHQRLQDERHAKNRPKTTSIRYCLPEDFESFSNHGITHDLYDPSGKGNNRGQVVTVCKDSPRIAVLFQMAAALDTPICDLVLFSMKRFKEYRQLINCPLRLSRMYIEDIDVNFQHVEDLDEKYKLIVEVEHEKHIICENYLAVVHRNQTTFHHDYDEGVLEFDVLSKNCREEWLALRKEEEEVLLSLHALFKENVPGMNSPTYDSRKGCNVWNAKEFLEAVRERRGYLSEEARELFAQVEADWVPLKFKFWEHFCKYGNFINSTLTHHHQDPNWEAEVMVAPLKVFDERRVQHDFLPLPSGVSRAKSLRESDSEEKDRDCDTEGDGDGEAEGGGSSVVAAARVGDDKATRFVTMLVAVVWHRVGKMETDYHTHQFYDLAESALKKRCPGYEAMKEDGKYPFQVYFSYAPERIFPLAPVKDNLVNATTVGFWKKMKTMSSTESEYSKCSTWVHPNGAFIRVDCSTMVVLSMIHPTSTTMTDYRTWSFELARTFDVMLVPVSSKDDEIALCQNKATPTKSDAMELDANDASAPVSNGGRDLQLSGNSTVLPTVIRICEKLGLSMERLLLVLGGSSKKGASKATTLWPASTLAHKNFFDCAWLQSTTVDNRRNLTIYFRVVPFDLCRLTIKDTNECHDDIVGYPFREPDRDFDTVDLRGQESYVEVFLVDGTLRHLRRQELRVKHSGGPRKAGSASSTTTSRGVKRSRSESSNVMAATETPVVFDQDADRMCAALSAERSLTESLKRRLGVSEETKLTSPKVLWSKVDQEADDSEDTSALIFFTSEYGLISCIEDAVDAKEGYFAFYRNGFSWIDGYHSNINDTERALMIANARLDQMANGWYDHPCSQDSLSPSRAPPERYHLCAQLVSSKDLLWMSGKPIFNEFGHEIRGVVIKVQFFKLHGPSAKSICFDVETTDEDGVVDGMPKDKRRYNRPFFSYIRQDDTYQTLCKRIKCVLYGEEEEECDNNSQQRSQMAVEDASTDVATGANETGAPVVEPSAALPGTADGTSPSQLRLAVIDVKSRANFLEMSAKSAVSVWDKVKASYPTFCDRLLYEVLDGLNDENSVCSVQKFPTLGIQLSEGKIKEVRRSSLISTVLAKRKISDTNINIK